MSLEQFVEDVLHEVPGPARDRARACAGPSALKTPQARSKRPFDSAALRRTGRFSFDLERLCACEQWLCAFEAAVRAADDAARSPDGAVDRAFVRRHRR